MSNDGTLLVTISHDQSMKIFDVVNFDMMHMLQLPFVPAAAEWVYRVSRRLGPEQAPRVGARLRGFTIDVTPESQHAIAPRLKPVLGWGEV